MASIERAKFKLPHAGPYVARITNHLDPTYNGGIEVLLEQGINGRPDLKERTVIVSYMSPFYGVTSAEFEGNNPANYNDVQKSYGMWMVPPDIGSRVICMFIEGDSNQGYWFGCVQDRWQNHMVPGIAASTNVAWAPGQKAKYGVANVPVAEFLKNNSKRTGFAPNAEAKPVHPFADRLLAQGLIGDRYRGVTSSSARREVPSRVFGISTPGPIDKNSPKKKIGYSTNRVEVPVSRTSGHTFVMDDGDVMGENQLVRIRSATGHQILFHDTANLVYIANADGTAWIEMTAAGKIDIYAKDSVSIHSENDFNFRADRDINFEAGRNLNVKSGNNLVLNSDNNFDLLTGQSGKLTFGATFELFGREGIKLTGGGDLDFYSSKKINLTSAAGGVSIIASGGDLRLNASKIVQNGSPGSSASVATGALSGTTRLQLFAVPGANGGNATTVMQRVPMHEPWTQHESYAPNNFTASRTDPLGGRTSASNIDGTAQAVNPAPVNPLADDIDLIIEFTARTGDKPHFLQLKAKTPAMYNAVIGLAKDYKKITGSRLRIESSYRGYEEQLALYNTWVAAGGPSSPNGYAAGIYIPAKPDKNKPTTHMQGIAVDVGSALGNKIAGLQLNGQYILKRNGLFRPVAVKDPGHIVLAASAGPSAKNE